MTFNNSPRDGFFAQLSAVQDAPPWSLLEALLVLGVLLVSLLLVGTTVTTLVAADNLNPRPVELLAGWMVGLVIAAAFVLIRWRRTQARFAGLRLLGEAGRTRRPLLLLVIIGVAAALTAHLIAALGSGGDFEPVAALHGIDNPALTTVGQLMVAGLFVAMAQPVAEGLVFFGVILPRLRSSIGAWPGLLTTALLFAGLHYLVYGARPIVAHSLWYGFALPLVAGLVFAALRVWMNSTRAAIAAYVGFGVVAFLVMLGV